MYKRGSSGSRKYKKRTGSYRKYKITKSRWGKNEGEMQFLAEGELGK